MYITKEILCLNRYAQFILNSNLSDAQSVRCTSVVHLSLCWMGVLLAEFYRNFNSTLSLGENQLVNRSNGSLLLSNNIWLVSNLNLSMRLATLLKKRLWHRCFPVIFAKFLGTPTPFYRTSLVAASSEPLIRVSKFK